jgi:L-lactate dehydrogenase complex protein LldG
MAKTAMTTARDAILANLAKGRVAAESVPDFALPGWTNDAPGHFIAKAKASVAAVHTIDTADDAPVAILAIMALNQLRPRLHLPSMSPLNALPWHRAPGLTITLEPPSGNDSAFSQADYGIAETGTLVFFSGPQSASSWHFRPGREFVLLSRQGIVPRFEEIIAGVKTLGRMPTTLNLITGPSRTADIEQTIELGAHGPRAIDILIAG